VTEQPQRGGAWDFAGRLLPEYSPRRDGDPDPGEIVWAWVPYEEDPHVGKDRPLIIIGRDVADHATLVGLMLSSKDHDHERTWHAIGAGPWDPEHRPSWVRLDRPLAVRSDAVRREGASMPKDVFLAVVERAAAAPRHVPRPASTVSSRGSATPRQGLFTRLMTRLRRR
jgi:hypothetical protein